MRIMANDSKLYRVFIVKKLAITGETYTMFYGPYESLNTASGILTYQLKYHGRGPVVDYGIQKIDPEWETLTHRRKEQVAD